MREDRTNAVECRDPQPTKSQDCWQCRQECGHPEVVEEGAWWRCTACQKVLTALYDSTVVEQKGGERE